MVVKTTSTTYQVSGDLDIFDNKLIIESGEEIDLSKIREVFLYLIYNFAEVEVTVFLGWIEPKELKRLHINRVRRIELQEDIIVIYIDFKELFEEGDSDV